MTTLDGIGMKAHWAVMEREAARSRGQSPAKSQGPEESTQATSPVSDSRATLLQLDGSRTWENRTDESNGARSTRDPGPLYNVNDHSTSSVNICRCKFWSSSTLTGTAQTLLTSESKRLRGGIHCLSFRKWSGSISATNILDQGRYITKAWLVLLGK